ncbi:methyltransferase domain-containing protein [Alkalimonas collagenimarina]|uniref:Methyltransferase domain-containing protein n=1 Tax=Alkalimonas collagenimarina TaxID=400390 RepID=A0ABT9H297_9GAMM|nr:methyltransferase domain-containing protein [Alkalimonas collagenimarina]MDP4537422.1 methyltransferase domain-containing protein [Alkalimonas collagenimarina]
MSAQFQAVADHFSKASDSYFAAARLQQQTGYAALELLPDYLAGQLLDLGCGPGWLHPELTIRCQSLLAVDLSQGMLDKAKQQQLAAHYIRADAAELPLADASVDGVFSNLMLQWCPQPDQVSRELARVCKPGASLVLTTLLDGTLRELKQAFQQLDARPHVNDFLPADVLLERLKSASPDIEWHLQTHSMPLPYPDVLALARELKSLGANYVVGKTSKGLTGKQYWQRLNAAYPLHDTHEQVLASYEVGVLTGTRR